MTRAKRKGGRRDQKKIGPAPVAELVGSSVVVGASSQMRAEEMCGAVCSWKSFPRSRGGAGQWTVALRWRVGALDRAFLVASDWLPAWPLASDPLSTLRSSVPRKRHAGESTGRGKRQDASARLSSVSVVFLPWLVMEFVA